MLRFFVGGVAVAKYLRIFVCFFLITLLVIHTDRKRAEAVLPAALAAAAPYVLDALVLGTGALWCYTHGGAEAWVQFTGAVNDGVQVTKDWIQKKIAEAHGINTETNVIQSNTFLEDGRIYSGGYAMNKVLMSVWTGSKYWWDYWYPGRTHRWQPNNGPTYIYGYHSSVEILMPNGDTNTYSINTVQSYVPPAAFDPADHPELFTGPALLANCHALAKTLPGLVLQTGAWSSTKPNVTNPVYVPPVHLVAVNADGSAIDSTGKKWPPLAGAPWPAILPVPQIAPETTGEIQVQTTEGVDTITVPKDVKDKLTLAGVPAGAVLIGASPTSVTYRDPATGQTYVVPLPSEVAESLPDAVTKDNSTSSTGLKGTETLTSPGLPGVSEFRSDFEYDEPEPWAFTAWMANPFRAIIDSMRIEAASSSSVITFPINLGFKQFSVSADFAQYASSFQFVGGMLVIMSYFMAIMLVVKK